MSAPHPAHHPGLPAILAAVRQLDAGLDVPPGGLHPTDGEQPGAAR